MGARRKFTDEQIEYCKKKCRELSAKEIARNIGLTKRQVYYIVNKHTDYSFRESGDLSRIWSDEEIEVLKDPNLTDYEKVQLLPNRTDSAVRMQRRRLGFESKPVEFRRRFFSQGYKYLRVDGGYEKRSRLVMENHIGRKIAEGEVVHHINGKKADDRIENLYLCDDRAEHSLVHHQAFMLVGELVDKGIIKFDKENGEYVYSQHS